MIVSRPALVLALAFPLGGVALADAPDDLSSTDASHLCVDGSDVVGYRQCPSYGTWGTNLLEPYVYIDFGLNRRHFNSTVRPTALARSTTVGTTPGAIDNYGDDALTFDERLGVGLTRGIYLAFDFELGNFDTFNKNQVNARDVVLDGLVAIGVRLPLGPLALSAELAGGGMAYSYQPDVDFRTTWLAEARGRAEVWLAPWFSVGAMLGTSLIQEGEWLGGIYLGFHTYAYAGDRY
jgi:hypothetical protein